MIQIIKSYSECRDFVSGFQKDTNFADPMLSNEAQVQCNLISAIENPDSYRVFGIYREDQLIGLFAFLVLRDEQYIEMLDTVLEDKKKLFELL